jgi:hypothetical protein
MEHTPFSKTSELVPNPFLAETDDIAIMQFTGLKMRNATVSHDQNIPLLRETGDGLRTNEPPPNCHGNPRENYGQDECSSGTGSAAAEIQSGADDNSSAYNRVCQKFEIFPVTLLPREIVQAAQIGKHNHQHGKQKHETEGPCPGKLLCPRILQATGNREQAEVRNSCAHPYQAQVSNEKQFVREHGTLDSGEMPSPVLLPPFAWRSLFVLANRRD